ncbi:hypothetical protein [Serratia fonticola]
MSCALSVVRRGREEAAVRPCPVEGQPGIAVQQQLLASDEGLSGHTAEDGIQSGRPEQGLGEDQAGGEENKKVKGHDHSSILCYRSEGDIAVDVAGMS